MSGEIVTIGSATLHHADCRDVLPTLGKFDLLLTDPPYGIDRGGQGERFVKNPKHKRNAHADLGWDSQRPEKSTFDEMRFGSAEQIVWGGNYFADFLPPTMGWLYWDKGQRGLTMSDGELAWTSRNAALRSIVCNRSALVGSVHPTQKPLTVMSWCLTFFPTAKTVLDPFMGSGTTGVACIQSGRAFTGIERERKYFDIACERIFRAQAQGMLFDPVVAKPEQQQLAVFA